MKILKLLISCLIVAGLISHVVYAKNNKIVEETTVGKYQKPGAPIELSFKSTRVGLDEVSDINISLSTALKSGDIEVSINIDENLQKINNIDDKIIFNISAEKKSYNINLKISGTNNGLYYVRLLTKVKTDSSNKTRAFAIPVYIGDGQLKHRTNQLMKKDNNGENISISKGEEEILISNSI